MNIFGVGSAEFVLILIIALIVAGPKRLIEWSYIAGRYVGQLKMLWSQMVESLQQDLDEAGVDIKLPKQLPNRSNIDKVAGEVLRPLAEPMQQALKDSEAEVKKLDGSIKELADEAKVEASLPSLDSEESTGEPQAKTGFGTWSGEATPPEDQE
jgi:Sec-independent protein translocase protein TatA